MKTRFLPPLIVASLVLQAIAAPAPDQGGVPSAATSWENNRTYKMITGYKQPFNDDLQLHLSKGWTPVGGVSVTSWNNDLYYAQLLSRPAAQ